jgi:cytochrome c-type biogenesis protein CcmE
MRKRSQRLWVIGIAAALLIVAVPLAAIGFKDAAAFFYSPTDVVTKNVAASGKNARIGGLVEYKTVTHDAAGVMHFRITDTKNSIPVVFDQIPPDLFRECQGVIAEGKFDAEGRLVAKRVLAKHDENYIPQEMYAKMKDAVGEEGMMKCQAEAGQPGRAGAAG